MRYTRLLGCIAIFVFGLVGCEDEETQVDPVSPAETETAEETETPDETADASSSESTDSTFDEPELTELSFSCTFACFVGTECRSTCEEITVEAYLAWEEIDNEWVQPIDQEAYDQADTQCTALYETVCESAPLDLEWTSSGGPPGYDSFDIEFAIETHLGGEYCSDFWKEPCFCDHEATNNKYNKCYDVDENTPLAWREICLESNTKSIEICGETQVCSPFDGPGGTQTCVEEALP